MQNTEEYKRVAPGIDLGRKTRYSAEFREQVAQLVAQGLKNGEIAQRMGVKPQAIADMKKCINWRVKEILGLEIDGSPKVGRYTMRALTVMWKALLFVMIAAAWMMLGALSLRLALWLRSRRRRRR